MSDDKKNLAGASGKKLQLSKETLRSLSVKSGMRTGLGLVSGAGGSVCTASGNPKVSCNPY